MSALLPRTLRARLLLVTLSALAIAQGLSLWLFVDERGLAVQAALSQEVVGRAANVALLLNDAPPDLRPAIVQAAGSPLVRFSVGPDPATDHTSPDTGHDVGNAVAGRIRALIGGEPRDVRVDLHRIRDLMPPMAGMSGSMDRMHQSMTDMAVASVEMQISIHLKHGDWLNVDTRFHHPPYQWARTETATFAVSAGLIALALWFVLGRLTGPLRALSAAAEQLGRGGDVAEIPPSGPDELRHLTTAFNTMQQRLTKFIADRTHLLAALGHDLRSPLTALRVRAEMVDDAETRERLIVSIAEMQDMVEATLAFASAMATQEQAEVIDLSDIARAVATEFAETGGAVSFAAASEKLPVRVRPVSLRRALRNVIDNALRYGERAEVTLAREGETAVLMVSDQGPGIAAKDFERVFDPFVRLEASRSRDTGGTGLGLSIARTIVRAQGGDIQLQNGVETGLIATITLPVCTSAITT